MYARELVTDRLSLLHLSQLVPLRPIGDFNSAGLAAPLAAISAVARYQLARCVLAWIGQLGSSLRSRVVTSLPTRIVANGV